MNASSIADISSRADLIDLLNEFYNKAQSDDVIGDKFSHLNMIEHTETIADFWDSILFGTNRYHGDPFGKHISLNLSTQDFDRWIFLFNETIENKFAGPKADEAKFRAGTIAKVFKHKLNLA